MKVRKACYWLQFIENNVTLLGTTYIYQWEQFVVVSSI